MTQATLLPAQHPLNARGTADSALIRAYQGERPATRPIWMMRQAGRSLPEYRALREGVAMLDSCLRPDMAAEITLQPVRRHKVDAAIFFSDIVVPLKLAGVDVEIAPGVGPVMGTPVRSRTEFAALPELEESSLAPIAEAIGIVTDELGSTPLIGFCGAPFTLASYLIEGRPSREYAFTKAMMREDPALWNDLLSWVARTTGTFLRGEIHLGEQRIPAGRHGDAADVVAGDAGPPQRGGRPLRPDADRPARGGGPRGRGGAPRPRRHAPGTVYGARCSHVPHMHLADHVDDMHRVVAGVGE
jgi:hypothetical protein